MWSGYEVAQGSSRCNNARTVGVSILHSQQCIEHLKLALVCNLSWSEWQTQSSNSLRGHIIFKNSQNFTQNRICYSTKQIPELRRVGTILSMFPNHDNMELESKSGGKIGKLTHVRKSRTTLDFKIHSKIVFKLWY